MNDERRRKQLADFLRSRRLRLSPREAGLLVETSRRRITGLRRRKWQAYQASPCRGIPHWSKAGTFMCLNKSWKAWYEHYGLAATNVTICSYWPIIPHFLSRKRMIPFPLLFSGFWTEWELTRPTLSTGTGTFLLGTEYRVRYAET